MLCIKRGIGSKHIHNKVIDCAYKTYNTYGLYYLLIKGYTCCRHGESVCLVRKQPQPFILATNMYFNSKKRYILIQEIALRLTMLRRQKGHLVS